MKGKLIQINNIWYIILLSSQPGQQLELFQPEMTEEEYNEQHAIDIYQLRKIEIENWEVGKIVNGEIIRVKNKIYFQISEKDVKYKEDNFNLTKTNLLLEVLLGNFEKVAITKDQYDKLLQIAKSENVISSYFSNGFCINYKFVVYGKLNKNKNIIYPQIKIK